MAGLVVLRPVVRHLVSVSEWPVHTLRRELLPPSATRTTGRQVSRPGNSLEAPVDSGAAPFPGEVSNYDRSAVRTMGFGFGLNCPFVDAGCQPTRPVFTPDLPSRRAVDGLRARKPTVCPATTSPSYKRVYRVASRLAGMRAVVHFLGLTVSEPLTRIMTNSPVSGIVIPGLPVLLEDQRHLLILECRISAAASLAGPQQVGGTLKDRGGIRAVVGMTKRNPRSHAMSGLRLWGR